MWPWVQGRLGGAQQALAGSPPGGCVSSLTAGQTCAPCTRVRSRTSTGEVGEALALKNTPVYLRYDLQSQLQICENSKYL